MEPNERGQTNDRPNLIDKPVAKPGLFVSTPRAREKRGKTKEKEKKRTERRKKNEGAPSYDTRVQGHQKGRAPSYPGTPKEEGRGRKERKREREREREGRKRIGVPSYERASRDTPERERERWVHLSIPFRNTPEGKEGRGGGKGEEAGG